MVVSEAVPVEQQNDYVPQFATSPAALEMYPEEAAPADEAQNT